MLKVKRRNFERKKKNVLLHLREPQQNSGIFIKLRRGQKEYDVPKP
jgi:hypothetical protein